MLQVRISDEEKVAFTLAAGRRGLNLSGWVRMVLRDECPEFQQADPRRVDPVEPTAAALLRYNARKPVGQRLSHMSEPERATMQQPCLHVAGRHRGYCVICDHYDPAAAMTVQEASRAHVDRVGAGLDQAGTLMRTDVTAEEAAMLTGKGSPAPTEAGGKSDIGCPDTVLLQNVPRENMEVRGVATRLSPQSEKLSVVESDVGAEKVPVERPYAQGVVLPSYAQILCPLCKGPMTERDADQGGGWRCSRCFPPRVEIVAMGPSLVATGPAIDENLAALQAGVDPSPQGLAPYKRCPRCGVRVPSGVRHSCGQIPMGPSLTGIDVVDSEGKMVDPMTLYRDPRPPTPWCSDCGLYEVLAAGDVCVHCLRVTREPVEE